MTPFEASVSEAFAEQGVLARGQPGMRPRAAQQAMAQAVARALETAGVLAVEAGTGVGKTFAYLVPLLLSGRHALLSTATQALQDQLFFRDIPAVSRALGLSVRVALLKGRSSYVCLHRLEQARAGPAASQRRDPAILRGLDQVQLWANASRSGDLAELSGLDERSLLRPLISSTRDNCLGAACPRLAGCHVNRARAEAMAADWVVINHHLFFADQQLSDTGLPALLPQTEVLVFDEAHQLNPTGVTFLGWELGSDHLLDLARELASMGPRWAGGQRPWAHLALGLEQAVRTVAQMAPDGVSRCRWPAMRPEGVEAAAWSQAAGEVARALRAAGEALAATAGASAELQRLLERVQHLFSEWLELNRSEPPAPTSDGPGVRWVEWKPQEWRVVCAPLDASAHFRKQMALQGTRTWIFTSATLGNNDTLDSFTGPLGLQGLPQLRTLRVPSPFDHAAQASLYVPHDLPEPADPEHTPALARRVAAWAVCLGGRTLVLTTTLRAVQRMANQLAACLPQGERTSLQVLAQGQFSRRALLDRFRAAAGPGAVLVASASFWEGVDLPGDVLQLLVIDKLPFPAPDDPLIAAQAEQLKAAGQSPFNHCYLPQASLALKQGVGRLIRSETDRGVLVIGDSRLLTRSYGNLLMEALPPMKRVVDETELFNELNQLALTRASTTVFRCS